MAKEENQQTPGAPDVPAKLKKTIKHEKEHPKVEKSPDLLEDQETTEDVKISEESAAKSTDKVEQVIESAKTDEAVADIVRKESDQLLDSPDGPAEVLPKPKKSRGKHKWIVWTIILVLLAGISTVMAIPKTRYEILNRLGVRVSASLTVVDKTTGQPLKNVAVELAGNSVNTDQDGNVAFEGLKQGPQNLKISRVAFSPIDQQIILGWGSNPLGRFELSPSGAQYTFIVHDSLADQPIEGAEVTSGQAVAKSDKDGKAVLTLEQTNKAEVTVTISADNYRSEQKTLPIQTDTEVKVNLIPAQKAVFVNSSDGKYNLYSMYIDGQDRKVILEGTGNESSDMALSVSTDGNKAAFVSTRENIKNENGGLLQTLTLADVSGQASKTMDRAAEVELIDWIGTVLIYQITSPGVSQDSTDRQKLISYDYSNDKRVELASANKFTAVASAQGAIYYSAGTDQFAMINADGSGRSTVVNAKVQHAFRTDYNSLTLQAEDGWYSLSLSSDTASKINAPSSAQNIIYVISPDGQKGLLVSGNTLNVYDTSNSKTTEIHSQLNLSYPVRWLNNDIAVFRDGGADYAISTKGGEASKIVDLVSTSGIIQAY